MSADGRNVYIQAGGAGTTSLLGRRIYMSASYGATGTWVEAVNNNNTTSSGVVSKDGRYIFFNNAYVSQNYGRSWVTAQTRPNGSHNAGITITSSGDMFCLNPETGSIFKLY
jgi:hypothetical protein